MISFDAASMRLPDFFDRFLILQLNFLNVLITFGFYHDVLLVVLVVHQLIDVV